MSKIARTAGLVASAALIAGAASAAPLPGFSLKAQTEHFAFYSRDGQKVDAARSERYLRKVEDMLGHQISGRAEYYRYGSAAEVAAGTGTYASGLTLPGAGQIHSTEEFHAHEIVHLVAGQIGDPGLFYQEGLAVAIGNEGRWRGANVDEIVRKQRPAALRTVLARFASLDAETAYPVAGSFVSSLIRRHGVARVTEFFRGSSSADAAFAGAFGETLEQAEAAWLASL